MANTLYMECYSGISGDMTVAALLDLGADREVLDQALKSLPVDGFETKISRVEKAGLDVCDFEVILDKAHENYDHDMEYLHGHYHDHTHHKHDDVHHAHNNGHHDDHDHVYPHEHRGLKEILHIIDHAAITDQAKATAEKIFRILAEAEAKAHGVPLEEVHFHEVGAVDSIVDIVAIAVCLDNLRIEDVIVPELYEGRGFVRCQHGVIPVPVPAVVNIAERHGLKLHLTSTEGELVTPTGAAVVAAIATSQTLPERFTIKKIGIGAGKRNYDRPSILRAILIESEERQEELQKTVLKDTIYRLETNIDDCSGEQLGYVMEQLFEAGARDVHYIPVFMKKNRPAYQLNVICTKESIPVMEQIIFAGTTTIGIRRVEMERTVLKREQETVHTSFGDAEVKICTLPDGSKRCYPEYERTIRLAQENGISYQEAYMEVRKAAMQKNGCAENSNAKTDM